MERSETSFAAYLVSAILGSPLVLFLTALLLGYAGAPVSDFGLAGLLVVILIPPALYVIGLGRVMNRPQREWVGAGLVSAAVTFCLALMFIVYVASQVS